MAGKKQPSKPAFPQPGTVEAVARHIGAPGMSDRSLFAAFSLAGLRAAGHDIDGALAARKAFVDADAMLAEQAGAQ